MKSLDFDEEKIRIETLISSRNNIVLATSDKNRVTARTVYCVSDGLKIYFLTSKAYLKFKQIEKNPNVALCFDNVQIEGTAAILGHPSDKSNSAVMEKAARHKPFMSFVKYKNTVLIEVTISSVELWENHKRVFLDIVQKKCTEK